MAAEPVVVDFQEHDRDEVTAAMRDMRRSGGWLNLSPELTVDEPPPTSPLFGLFSARGPIVPLATWSPGTPGREPTSIGVQHGTGPNASRRLAQAGLPLPAGWTLLADHPKRGLVATVPDDADDAKVLAWLLDVTASLCPLPRSGRWRALRYAA